MRRVTEKEGQHMTLADKIKKQQSLTYTENGALALNTSADALLDLFAVAGALRRREAEDIEIMFGKALVEDKLLATKLAFYTRDVRGGLGERRTGRIMFRYLAKHYPDIMMKNLDLIAEYGRYDDLIDLLELLPFEVITVINRQLKADIANMADNKPVSLLAKWLPSINTSNKETVAKGRKIAALLKMTEREYRKTLSSLRKYLNVTEVNLSKKDYASIIYPEVPSKAMTNYRNAFTRNDGTRFQEFLDAVNKGEAKINSSVLYPYDITEKYIYQLNAADPVLEAQWEALPDYVDRDARFLIMADVSGSMYGRPMATSVGLAMYLAQRNKGPFANTFMTFSSKPELVTIKGDSLYEKIRYIMSSAWQMNTDLEAAFDLLLKTAVAYKVPAEELPDSIVVITDMEFDICVSNDWLFYDQMEARYSQNGYKLPNIVFWNVNSRHNTYHASFDKKGVQLASGQSPAVFESLVKGIDLTPYEYMLSVLDTPRYQAVTV